MPPARFTRSRMSSLSFRVEALETSRTTRALLDASAVSTDACSSDECDHCKILYLDSWIALRVLRCSSRELQGWDKVRFHLCTIDNRSRSPALVMLTSHV